MVVLLPAPFGPRKPKISPGRTSIVRSSSATMVRPKRLPSPSVTMTLTGGGYMLGAGYAPRIRGHENQRPRGKAEGAFPMPKTVPPLPGVEPSALPFSKVVEANGFVFVAGQVGDTPGRPGAVPGGIEAETRAALDNVGRLLRAVGLDYGDVVKATV